MRSSWGDKALKSPKGILNVASRRRPLGLNVDLSYLSKCTKKVFKRF